MGSLAAEPPKPWIETPLIRSIPLSRAAGCNIFLKLENLQPSGSFKSRGIGNLMFRAAASSPSQTVHFYCSSEGNAGLACATSAIALGAKATIVVPVTAAPAVIRRLRDVLGATVVQTGSIWPEADAHLRSVLLAPENQPPDTLAVYVPPFDHPDVWAGAATLVDEITAQVPPATPVDAIVCSVGGGGLLNGVMEGVARHGKALGRGGSPPKVLALETVGADSLNASVRAGEHVTLPAITSIAKSLGATRVSAKSWEWARTCEHLISETVTDGEAALACVRFLEDMRILVEPACGATVVTAYNGHLRKHVGKGLGDEEWATRNVVLVVCGGSNANIDVLQEYRETYNA
ncbi:tryptophan synthase beta subunit-like PLP-dependent enzyme [Cercophora newfieldiana]|uniref:L-serine ammonia-lyase n=1 Tax=Cercophora newfieldiana TaxID=92897 RepID=A0AA40CWK9_9PEZI|nr:tryptophan synthase beta subunit-like PLP-dependent enzyme [Cercophora newfieldiana]